MTEESTPPTEDRDRVVAIDGPSGSGKSSVARALAAKLGFQDPDTGAMYRAVTWHILRENVPLPVPESRTRELLDGIRLEWTGEGRIALNGEDVTEHLRSQEVESRVSMVSAMPEVRERMRSLQREVAAMGPVVAEGRDMATVVFPRARWKFYIDAAPRERARRRCADFRSRGREVSEAEVLEEIEVRDGLDSTRKDAPLTRAAGAIYVDSTEQTLHEVIETLARIVQEQTGES